jgi:hypothetical protein
MSGIIVTTPPTVEVQPGNNANNPSSLPPVTYRYALLNVSQTWGGVQTFPLGTISINAADVLGLATGGNPGGATSQVQFNNGGSFGGTTGATSDGTTLTLIAPILGTPVSGTLTNCTAFTLTTTGTSGAATYSAGVLNIPRYDNTLTVYGTRAAAAAATIPTTYTAIQIMRHTAGYPSAPAIYIPGTISGPMAFQEVGGHYWELDLTGGTIDPRWFGAKCDGVADDTTALQAALTKAIGGNQLFIPTGTMGISAALDGAAGNVRIFGAGKSKSIIKVLGSNVVDPVLKFTDASDWTVEGVDFQGNGITTVIGPIHALVTAGSNVIGSYVIQNNAFSNFKAQFWLRFLTNVASTSHTRRMRNIRILNNSFSAPTSLAPDFTSVGIPSMMIGLQGSIDNNGSYIDDVIIQGNYADCSGVKGFANCWAGVKNVIIDNNIILNAGSLGQNDRGCYALLAYNNHASADVTYSPMDILITNNIIVSPRSMGFYGATAFRVTLTGNTITGVQDTTAASLPYAAISLGQCEDSKANFNELNDNYVAIQAIPTPTSVTMEVIGNKIKSSVANGIAIRSVVVGGTFTNKLKIVNNQIIMTGSASAGINCASVGAGLEYDKLDIVNNRMSTLGTGILCLDSSGGGIRANQVTIQGNHVEGAFVSSAINVDSAVAKTVAIDNTINLASAGALATGFFAPSTVSLQIDGLTLLNRATGTAFAFSASAAIGAVRNVNFVGIARANLPADASGHLGFQIPTFTGAISAVVQNLSTTAYTEAGAASSKYTVLEWINTSGSTTWLPRRSLSGN